MKMKKMFLKLIVCMLLITSTVIPSSGLINIPETIEQGTSIEDISTNLSSINADNGDTSSTIQIIDLEKDHTESTATIIDMSTIDVYSLFINSLSVNIDTPSGDVTSRLLTVTGSATTSSPSEKITSWAWTWIYNGTVIDGGGDSGLYADWMSFEINIVGLFLGINTIQVEVINNIATSASDSAYFNYIDIFDPVLEILSPSDGSTLIQPNINVNIYADDHYGTPYWGSGVKKIHWHHSWSGDEYEDSYAFDKAYDQVTMSFPITLRSGENTLQFWAEDLAHREQAYPDQITVTYISPEDNTPPVTTKTVGEPCYGDNDYWVDATTPFTLSAQDNLGGSGVQVIYYRTWNETSGWGEWTTYTNSFTLTGTNGNCKYYLEYYAVDNEENNESIHNQTHVVDNGIPVSYIDFNGSYCSKHDNWDVYPEAYISIQPETEVVFCGGDTCCQKIEKIEFDFNWRNCFMVWGDVLDDKQSKTKIYFDKIYIKATNKDLSVDGTWFNSSQNKVTLEFPEGQQYCIASLVFFFGFGVEKPTHELSIFHDSETHDLSNKIEITCAWLDEISKKGWHGIASYSKDAYYKLHWDVGKGCKNCDTKNAGLSEMQYRFAWESDPEHHIYTGPFTLLGEGWYNISYRAIDNLGHSEPIQTLTLYVDGTPPPCPTVWYVHEDEDSLHPFIDDQGCSFSWDTEGDPSGVFYTFQLATDPSFTDIVVDKVVLNTYVGEANINVNVANGNLYCDTTYYGRVVNVTDLIGNIAADCSKTWSFHVAGSTPPGKPNKLTGPIWGKLGINHTYTTSTIDPEGELIWYNFSWGDETYSGWLGPYASGAEASASHNWSEKGNYDIKVQSMDECGARSEWSDPLSVKMPKTYTNPIIQLILKMLERFPFL